MNIFKNKSVVRLYAFVTACLIIITLLLSGFNVCAEENTDVYISDYFGFNTSDLGITKCWNYNDYMSSEIGDSNANVDGYYYQLNQNNTSIPLYLDGDTQNGEYKIPSSFNINGTVYNLSDYGYFAITKDSNQDLCILYPADIYDQGYLVSVAVSKAVSGDENFKDLPIIQIPINSNGTYGSPSLSNYNTWTQSTVHMYMKPAYDSYFLGNVPLKTIDKTKLPSNLQNVSGIEWWYCLAGVSYGNNQWGDPNDYLIDANYLILDYDNPITDGGGGGASGDATNNMYFNDFNISYSVSGLYSGNIVCYGDLNDYQKEHLDEFALTYSLSFDYSFYVPSVGGWTETFTKNYSYQQTLSDFYNNSSSKTFTLRDIMQNINTQDINSEYGNLYQLINHYANQGTDLNSLEVHWTKAKMKTTVFIVSSSDSPSDILNSSDLHSNSFSKGYNFLDGKSSTYSDGITSNNNPYQNSESGSIENENQLNNMDTGVTSSNIPSSQGDNGGSGTSVVTGDNNIIINNNPTFNNDGSVSGSGGGSSDGGVASTFYNTFNPFKTLFSSLNGDNSVISDETAETIGSNRFISVMSSTFSFIPEGMWTALTTFFIASLSILVVAVVIRVLLDLL